MTTQTKIILFLLLRLFRIPHSNMEVERKVVETNKNSISYQDTGIEISRDSNCLSLEIVACKTAIVGLATTPGDHYQGIKWEVIFGHAYGSMHGRQMSMIRPYTGCVVYPKHCTSKEDEIKPCAGLCPRDYSMKKTFDHKKPALICNESKAFWLEWNITSMHVGYGLVVREQQFLNYTYPGREHEAPKSWNVKIRNHRGIPAKYTFISPGIKNPDVQKTNDENMMSENKREHTLKTKSKGGNVNIQTQSGLPTKYLLTLAGIENTQVHNTEDEIKSMEEKRKRKKKGKGKGKRKRKTWKKLPNISNKISCRVWIVALATINVYKHL